MTQILNVARGRKPADSVRGEFTRDLHRRCRNPRCKSRLETPVDNPHKAFCTAGCHAQFYFTRCVVCENDKPAGRSDRKFCRRPKCRTAYRKNKGLFAYPVPNTVRRTLSSKSPLLTGTFFWVFEGRGWRFEQAGNQWWLYDRENRAAVVFQREGKQYVIIKPHCIPEQSAPTLEMAYGLAKQLAMWALPFDPDTERRFRTVNNWDRIRRETAWGRRKSNTETARDFAPDEILAASAHVGSISADLEIPTFLRRELTGGETRQLAGQSLLAHVSGVLNRE